MLNAPGPGLRLAALLLAFTLAGCATPTSQAPDALGQNFYPSPPAPPRIQHLKTIASERDLGVESSDLAKFVLGDETSPTQLRQPYGVAMFEGKLYVADSRAAGLAVFDLAKRKLS